MCLNQIGMKGTTMAEKPIRELTDEELVAEHAKWVGKITSAISWGAGVAAADEFRKDCKREMVRRGIRTEDEAPRRQR